MARRNILLSYILAFSKNTWFWLGIWIFYYLRFTDYSGIGIIETVLILTTILAEIPTGAVADIFGKKITLIFAFSFEAGGAFMMAMAPSFLILLLSVFIMCIGGALYSGTLEALVYDSLKEEGKTHIYDKKISNISTISLISPALCGIIGGFLYKISPTLPFYANGIGYLLGLLASFFIVEPHIDTEKFSLRLFFDQTKKGLFELYKNSQTKKYTFLLLSIGFFVVISSEMVDSFLGYEFGFDEVGLGILWSVIFIVSAIASQITPFLRKYLNDFQSLLLVGILMSVTFIISPFVGIILGGVSLLFRSSLQGIFGNLSSTVINNNTDSKYRATTISTFNTIKNIPYVFTAYIFGSISNIFSAKTISLWMGVVLLIFLAPQFIHFNKRQKS